MLHLILGAAGSGKSTYLIEEMKKSAQQTDRKLLLIVPEQFSFQTERNCNKLLGTTLSNRVQVLSFTRLAHLIFRTYGGLTGNYADSIAKNIMMNLALNEVKDGLALYERSVIKSGFAELMLKTADELKNSAITPADFEHAVGDFPEGNLQDKSAEISLVYTTYDAMLNKVYRDPLDDLSRAVEKVQGTDFFENTIVFFDEFMSFTAVQRKMIEQIIGTNDTYFAFCCDRADESRLFEPTHKTAKSLISLAKRMDIKVAKHIDMGENKVFVHPELRHMERSILRNRFEQYDQPPEHIQVLLAPNEYDEIDYILSEVWALIKERGYRFKDIALITRDLENYRGVLESALKKYKIPYFMDETVSVETYPLMRFVSNLLGAADGNFDIPCILNMLKCGIAKFDLTQISYFENYLYTWNITKVQLEQPFTQNPRGFIDPSRVTEQDTMITALVNEIREAAVHAVSLVKQAEQTAVGYGEAIMQVLEQFGIVDQINNEVEQLNQEEQYTQAEEQVRLWDILVDIFEVLAHATGEINLPLRRYKELFDMSVCGYDMGSIPQSLDSVMIGSAERMIIGNPKVVFVFGVNDGVFPLSPKFDGVFTDSDREQLLKLGIELSKPIGDRILEERFSAYKSLCAPRETLYVSARLADVSGAQLYPSEVISQLTELFGKQLITYTAQTEIVNLCRTKETAFLQLAFHYKSNDGQTEALRNYFNQDELYQTKLQQLERASQISLFHLKDRKNAENLFGKRLYISPTQVENYYKCGFMFFCANGMKIRPRSKANLDSLSLGKVIHHVMELLLNDEHFPSMTEAQLRQRIEQILNDYIDSFMGGAQGKTARFMTLYHNTARSLLKLACNIQREFSACRFKPVSFELPIGDQAEVKPIQLQLSGGCSVKIIGEVDRVDSYEQDGKTFIRVVDYKSGAGKSFDLSEIYYGLNLQMLLYLFSIWENGEAKFGETIPAGVLYMPAGGALGKYSVTKREGTEADALKKIEEGFRMNGLLLQDKVIIDAMEQIEDGKQGVYIPVGLAKPDKQLDGEPFTEKSLEFLVTLDQMKAIKEFAKHSIKKMCEQLFAGEVGAVPLETVERSACDWCAYQAVCGHTTNDPNRTIEPLDKNAFLQKILEENGDE